MTSNDFFDDPLPRRVSRAVVIRGNVPRAQVLDYERQMKKLGRSHVRGVLYALNGVAKEARKDIEDALPQVIDQPSKWTMRGIYNTYTSLKEDSLDGRLKDDISSSVGWKRDQSVMAKYLHGDGPNKRYPGDIGPGDNHIYVPLKDALRRYEGIRLINGQTLPRHVLKALHRRAGRPIADHKGHIAGGSRRTAARDSKKNQLFIGAPKIGGEQMGLGIWVRPKRGYVGEDARVKLRDANGKYVDKKRIKGRRLTNLGAPAMLVAMVDQTTHDPIMQAPWDEITARAVKGLPRRLEAELKKTIAHVRYGYRQGSSGWNGRDFTGRNL